MAGRDFVTPDDLAHIPLLIAKRNLVQEALRGWFGGRFESMEIVGTYNLICNAAVMMKNGVAAARFFAHVQKCSKRMAGDKI